MPILKRAFISIKRHPVRTGLLFSSICLLMLFMSVAISMSRGMINTDAVLRARLPAVATISFDQLALELAREERGDVEIEWIKLPLLREIGNMPYVRSFDYTADGNHFYSEEIIRAFPEHLFSELQSPIHMPQDMWSLSIWGIEGLEEFRLRGVHYPAVVDIQSGLIDLIEGRTFTQEEIDTGARVVILSRPFLEVNRLSLGDTLVLDFRIYHNEALSDQQTVHRADIYHDEHIQLSQTFEFEIIGVFDQAFEVLPHFSAFEIELHIALLNRIYVPSTVVETTVEEILIDVWLENAHDEAFLTLLLERQHIEEIVDYRDFMFLLEDPMYMAAFSEAATALLPEFWRMVDLSNAYDDFVTSMRVIQDVANTMIHVGMFAVMVILSLLVLLFLRERRYEIGIYLALGAYKKNVVLQLLLEFFIIAICATTLALFLGNRVASQLSTNMLRQEMTQLAEDEMRIRSVQFDTPQGMGFIVDLTMEDLIELNDTSLNHQTVVIFYGLSLTTIFLSLVLPMWLLMKQNPKDVLAFNQT